MAIFETADQLYACIGGLFSRLRKDTEIQEQLSLLRLSVQFTFSAPTATIVAARTLR